MRKMHSETVKASIRPITRLSVSEGISQQIIELISTGKLKPGQRLPSERELCKSFGASRSSVREALRSLSMLNILESRVGDGTVAAVNSAKFLKKVLKLRLITQRDEVEDLLKVRCALECLAVAEAAIRRTDEDVEKLDRLIEAMDQFGDRPTRFAGIDFQFHLAIAQMSQNTLLFDMVSMIRGQTIDGISRVFRFPNALSLSFDEHKKIVAAIRRGDAEKARAAMKGHLDAAIERYRVVMGRAADTKAIAD